MADIVEAHHPCVVAHQPVVNHELNPDADCTSGKIRLVSSKPTSSELQTSEDELAA